MAYAVEASITDRPVNQRYTLQQICDRLQSGAESPIMTSFTEPTSGPTDPSMCSLNDIMNLAPSADDVSGATSSDVRSGRVIWGLRSGAGWGRLSGAINTNICPSSVVCVLATGQGYESYAARDDGDLRYGLFVENRISDNGDGTVTDNATNLVWLKDANCNGSSDWNAAIDFANGLQDGSCGLSDGSASGDWRMPNIIELESVQDLGGHENMLPFGSPIDNMPTAKWERRYWASTTCSHDANLAWGGYFYDDPFMDGVVECYSKSSTFLRSWPVRDAN